MANLEGDLSVIDKLLAVLFKGDKAGTEVARYHINDILNARGGRKLPRLADQLESAEHMTEAIPGDKQMMKLSAIRNPRSKTRAVQRLNHDTQGFNEHYLHLLENRVNDATTAEERQGWIRSMHEQSQQNVADKDTLHRLLAFIMTMDPHIPF